MTDISTVWTVKFSANATFLCRQWLEVKNRGGNLTSPYEKNCLTRSLHLSRGRTKGHLHHCPCTWKVASCRPRTPGLGPAGHSLREAAPAQHSLHSRWTLGCYSKHGSHSSTCPGASASHPPPQMFANSCEHAASGHPRMHRTTLRTRN